jgi:hypothetical protein
MSCKQPISTNLCRDGAREKVQLAAESNKHIILFLHQSGTFFYYLFYYQRLLFKSQASVKKIKFTTRGTLELITYVKNLKYTSMGRCYKTFCP